ncbi:MAG TPA: trypsin-like peptidase domain-containing protein [Thermoanaerobaculia bacterium]|nr:trypsin-like peptidase domain-containing protein [Thermoanaerobaculia bacterium]
MKQTVLFSLVLVSALPAAAAGGSPSRAGLALQAAPVEVLAPATAAAPDAIEAIARHNRAGRLPTRNGFARDLERPRAVRLTAADLLRPTPFEVAGGVVTRTEAGSLVWSGEVAVTGAHGLRLHLSDVSLPPGSRLWTYAPGGAAVEIDPGWLGATGELWTGASFGDRARLDVEVPAAALAPGAEARFTLDRVLELVALGPDGSPLTGSEPFPKSSHCFVEMACAQEDFPSVVASYRLAVAVMFFVQDGSGFLCTGALLDDTDPTSRRPFLLTANHCVPDPAVASTVVSWFRFWNDGCGGPPTSGDQVVGAALRATGASADFSLLELSRLPPKPVFLDWTTASPGPGTVVSLLSHARGRPQVFSRHQVIPANGCADPARFFMTTTVFGGAGPGASGAPVVNEQGRVVGTVSGGCGPNPGDGCDPTTTVIFGRFSRAFPDLARFLDPEPKQEEPPDDGFLRTASLPGFKFKVEITAGGETREGVKEEACIPETLCVSGAVAGRSEVFVRIVGPKPNGKLWPTLVKFTTSRVDVTVVQEATGEERRYVLDGAAPGIDVLPGLFDRGGFDP